MSATDKEGYNNIIDITETHEKFVRVDVPENFEKTVQRRSDEDVKSGDLKAYQKWKTSKVEISGKKVGCKELKFWYINIRAITKEKLTELIHVVNMNELNVICITETHEKFQKVDIPKNFHHLSQRRAESDKKGGGLLLLTNKDVKNENLVSDCSDILFCTISVGQVKIKLLLVYMDVKDQDRNDIIRKKLNRILENIDSSEKIIILGDFNGHLGFVGPQHLDKNGKYVLDLMENFNLTLLNGDDNCNGEITRDENGNKSSIDFVLVNELMYEFFKHMEIDEHKNTYDLSDHCLINITFNLQNSQNQASNKKEIVEYLCVNDSVKDSFIQDVEKWINDRKEPQSLSEFEIALKETANKTLKRTYVKKFNSKMKYEDPVWFSKEIKENIKLRKKYNKLSRVGGNQDLRNSYREQYKAQKKVVQDLVKDSVTRYEIKITNEIKNDKNNKKMWKNINKLRGKNSDCEKVDLFDEDGTKIDENKIGTTISNYWINIYQKHINNIEQIWNDEKIVNYEISLQNLENISIECGNRVPDRYRDQFLYVRGLMQRIEAENINRKPDVNYVSIPASLVEHFDMVGRVQDPYSKISRMEKIEISESEVKMCLVELKLGKQPGPDGMKNEIYKWLESSQNCIWMLTSCFNKIITSKKYPNDWKISKTVLIPKNNKPKCNELRPIALTNTSYKIFMTIMKNKILQHLTRNNLINDYQAGFSKGRRLEDNVLLLNYCIKESKRLNKSLYVTAIDFTKAFDSIHRTKMIEMLIKYKCDPALIDIIASLYTDDNTKLFLNNKEIAEMNITSGIRQGCTGSPLLFTIVVNYVIDKVVEAHLGFKNDIVYIPVLFFADDGLLLSQSCSETVKMIEILTKAASDIGLEINVNKSNVIIFNKLYTSDFCKNMKVVDKIKYLGVQINNSENCFKVHKEEKLKQARKMANLTHSVIVRACNRLMVGKVYWKSVVLPSVLFASSVIVWTKKELKDLQTVENNVWRRVLNAPGYTPIAALRGDVGCSSMISRDRKNKLNYVRYILNGSCDLLKCVFNDMFYRNENNLISTIKTYMNELQISNLHQLMDIDENHLKKRIFDLDHEEWSAELLEKQTMVLYATFKNEIKEEKFYDNTFEASLIFKARSNVLKLDWRNRFTDGNVICKLCKNEEESLEHFILRCNRLDDIRREFNMRNRNLEEILLFAGSLNPSECKKYLGKLWNERKKILHYQLQ